MAGRRCPTKGCSKILTNGERYCPTHAREYEGRRGSPMQRGYGAPHRALRADWQRRIDAGETVACSTCPTPITKATVWQLGHDHVRGGYLGPQCVPCNATEAGRRGRAIQGQDRFK